MAFPTPYVEAAEDEFVWADDWKEATDTHAPSSSQLSHDGQEATLVGRIPWNMERSATRAILGFAKADTASPWNLRRELPRRHPIHPQMRAYAVTFAPYGPKANSASTTPAANAQNIDSPFDEPGENRVAYYYELLCTIRYRAFRYKFIEDDVIQAATALTGSNQEYQRFLFIDPEPTMDVLSADGVSQLTFAETGAGGGPTAGATGTRFPAPIGVLLTKTNLVVKWFGVPWDYLSTDETVFTPTKILDCVGKVNDGTFFGRAAGTLLMRPPRYFIKPFPGVIGDDLITPLMQVDLEIPMEYFKPTLGASSPIVQGHNNMPWRGAPGDPHGGKFFLATYGGGTTDPRLLASATFTTIFTHVSS